MLSILWCCEELVKASHPCMKEQRRERSKGRECIVILMVPGNRFG
jgi:hypothetical protein